MNERFVLREVAVLDERGGFADRQDVLVEDGVVAAVGPRLAPGDADSYDCSGL